MITSSTLYKYLKLFILQLIMVLHNLFYVLFNFLIILLKNNNTSPFYTVRAHYFGGPGSYYEEAKPLNLEYFTVKETLLSFTVLLKVMFEQGL